MHIRLKKRTVDYHVNRCLKRRKPDIQLLRMRSDDFCFLSQTNAHEYIRLGGGYASGA